MARIFGDGVNIAARRGLVEPGGICVQSWFATRFTTLISDFRPKEQSVKNIARPVLWIIVISGVETARVPWPDAAAPVGATPRDRP